MAHGTTGSHRRMCTGLLIRSLFNIRNAINQYRHSHHDCGTWGKQAFAQFGERVVGSVILWILTEPLWATAGPTRGTRGCQQVLWRMGVPIHRFIRRLWVHDRYLGLWPVSQG